MNVLVEDLKSRGFRVNDIPKTIVSAKRLVDAKKYDVVVGLFDSVKKVHDTAVEASVRLNNLKKSMEGVNTEGVDTPDTFRLFSLAELAFNRGDYASALARLEEAELTFSVETKGEFNWFVWVSHNLFLVFLIVVGLIVLVYVVFLFSKFFYLRRKLRLLKSEGDLLLGLIKDAQRRCFVENRISIGEYYDALAQFEGRLAEVSEGVIEYQSKLVNLFKFSSGLKRLGEEKGNLLVLIRDTQKEYFELGLIETRVYKTKVDSLSKRLSEVEEAMVLKDLAKTERLNRGFKKYFWRVFYRFFK